MKKRIKIIFLLMMFLPFIVNASSTINGGKEKANSFITSFENYKKYILFPTDSSKYAYEENGYNIVNGNGFLKGGFISAKEYRMSIHDVSSWLSPGISYWTLTKGSNNEYYYISNSIFTKDMNEKISVRITEFIHPSVTIKGTGTITNPWYFVEAFTVRLKSSNNNYGDLVSNGNVGEQILYVERNSTKSVNYTLTQGYEISTENISNCLSTYFSINDNKLIIKSIDRDLNCTINFVPKKLKVKLDSTGGDITSNTLDVIYSEEYGEIPTPIKKGYVFEGWYTKSVGGTRITEETIVTETKNHTLYAQWKAEIIKCSALTYKCDNVSNGTNPKLIYTGRCEVICDDDDNWRVKFLTSGDLKFTESLNIDAFLVGGGGGGTDSDESVALWDGRYYYGGGGGGGGYTKTKKDIEIVKNNVYPITIGAGGSKGNNRTAGTGGTTSAFDITASGGKGGSRGSETNSSYSGGNGGSGGGNYSFYTPRAGGSDGSDGGTNAGKGQGTTTAEFGEVGRTLYSGGGAGGRETYNWYCVDAGPSEGGGGGTAQSGTPNTGGGGGGGRGGNSAGNGGSGVVVIRNTIIEPEGKLTFSKLLNNYKCNYKNESTDGLYFTYTGDCQLLNDSGINFKILFKTNGTLKMYTPLSIDAFLVGGGGGGAGNTYGTGGNGGEAITKKGIELSIEDTYTIAIGPGGAGGGAGGRGNNGSDTTAFGITAHGGIGGGKTNLYGSSGGKTSSGDCTNAHGKSYGIGGQYKDASSQTTCEFNDAIFDSNGTITGCKSKAYSPGGGAKCTGDNCGYGNCGSRGGTYGGGAGAAGRDGYTQWGGSATANTGGGGGGGSVVQGNEGSGGTGGSGIVIIRNQR